MNYAVIKKCDIANGEGVRVSLFVSGCTHRCQGCFNEVAWDFSYGKLFAEEAQKEIFSELDLSYIRGLSLLGGEPFEPVNQRGLLPFLKRVKEKYPQKDIWCYTGNTLREDLKGFKEKRMNTECTEEMLSLVDILVDGRFERELYDISLKFRGSSNQRIIDMNASRFREKIILFYKE